MILTRENVEYNVKFIILLLFSIPKCVITDWCEISSCENPSKHIMCLYKENSKNISCTELELTMDSDIKKIILHLHNDFRNKWSIQEWINQSSFDNNDVSDMQLMYWDNQLEELAIKNVLNCISDHDQCRDVERFKVGQNLNWEYKDLPFNAETGFYKWANEFKRYDVSGIKKVIISPETIHFTQAIWSRTRALGCAGISFNDLNSENYQSYIICNYGPTGNVENEYIYRNGRPCSKCPSKTKCGFNKAYPYLCGGEFSVDEPYRNRDISEGSISKTCYYLAMGIAALWIRNLINWMKINCNNIVITKF